MTTKQLISIVIIILVLCFAAIVVRREPLLVQQTENQSVMANLYSVPKINNMLTLIKLAQGEPSLTERGPYTIFAPTDDAFDKLPQGTFTNIKNDLSKVIRTEDNHIVVGYYPASSFKEGMKMSTVNAEILTIHKKNGKWYINDNVMITNTDIPSKNGIIHTIDTVLLPTQ